MILFEHGKFSQIKLIDNFREVVLWFKKAFEKFAFSHLITVVLILNDRHLLRR